LDNKKGELKVQRREFFQFIREVLIGANRIISLIKTGKGLKKETGKRGAGGDISLQIDLLAEEILIDRLLKFGPIWSEERGKVTGHSSSDKQIVIDPIDGSFNFKVGIPYFGLAVYWEKGVGVVVNLANGDYFYRIEKVKKPLLPFQIGTGIKKLEIGQRVESTIWNEKLETGQKTDSTALFKASTTLFKSSTGEGKNLNSKDFKREGNGLFQGKKFPKGIGVGNLFNLPPFYKFERSEGIIFERAYQNWKIVRELERDRVKFRSPGALSLSLCYGIGMDGVIFIGKLREFDYLAPMFITYPFRYWILDFQKGLLISAPTVQLAHRWQKIALQGLHSD